MDLDKNRRQDRPAIRHAVALKYRPGVDKAPIITAAGKGEIAEIILRLANEAGVPNHVDPNLAKLLSNLAPGSQIPEETYLVVASILAFVWKVDRKYHNENRGA